MGSPAPIPDCAGTSEPPLAADTVRPRLDHVNDQPANGRSCITPAPCPARAHTSDDRICTFQPSSPQVIVYIESYRPMIE